MLTSRQPIWIGWASDLTYFYNDLYKSIIGGKHPWALSRSTAEVWKEIWQDIGPMLAQARQGSEGTYVEAQLLIIKRNGYPEETYYTFSYTPIPDEHGAVGGIFCANTEDKQRVNGRARCSDSQCKDMAGGLRTFPRGTTDQPPRSDVRGPIQPVSRRQAGRACQLLWRGTRSIRRSPRGSRWMQTAAGPGAGLAPAQSLARRRHSRHFRRGISGRSLGPAVNQRRGDPGHGRRRRQPLVHPDRGP